MRSAVIVSTARTPIGRAYRGAFNDTQAQALGGHAVAHAVKRAGIDPAEVGDVVIGAALQQGSTGYNVGRQVGLRAGLPDSVAGMSIDRQCASGLMAIATAAKEIVHDGLDIAVGGGLGRLAGIDRALHRAELVTIHPGGVFAHQQHVFGIGHRHHDHRARPLRDDAAITAALAIGEFEVQLLDDAAIALVMALDAVDDRRRAAHRQALELGR